MPPIEQSDGFAKAAQTLRTRATQATDPAIKDDMLKAAEKFEDIHEKAALVFGQINQSLADTERLKAVQKRKARRSFWAGWMVLAMLIMIVGFSVKAGLI